MTTLFWFRQDLRLSDNPGLIAAAKQGVVLPIYILDDQAAGEFKMGSASRWWLHHSLTALNHSLDNKLNVYQGDAKTVIRKILQEHNIQAVYWNRRYEPWQIEQDTQIKAFIESQNLLCNTFNSSLLWEPWKITKKDGSYYKVFTPFYTKGCLQADSPRLPFAKPKILHLIRDDKNKTDINHLPLISDHPWQLKLAKHWVPGEKAAQNRLQHFIQKDLHGYRSNRNYPAKPNISRLSPHLHFGELSPYQVWHAIHNASNLHANLAQDSEHFMRELAWREFSYYLLYYFPQLPRQNFQSKFDGFKWENHPDFLRAWQKGQTGYPIIDAGMRELWETGYMHNRVRMIVASFLVKNCLLHWHEGENWFWDSLVDADLANNSASWQWVAGSGVDAAPYFRIFNPTTQGEKFDAEGNYTLHFVPELSRLPKKYLFKPWEAPESVLKDAGVVLGETYPLPIVDLKVTREKALKTYKNLGPNS